METLEIKTALEQFKSAVIGRVETLEKAAAEFPASEFYALKKEVREVYRGQLAAEIGLGTEPRESKAFYDAVRTGRESPDLKAMSAGSETDGGWLIPPQVDSMLTKYVRERSPMRQLAHVVAVQGGEYTELHSVLGTGASWVGETAARTATTSPTFKSVLIPTHEIYAAPAITQTLLDDNNFGLENWLVTELGDAFADAESDKFLNGDGTTCPRGLFTYTTAVTADATRAHDTFQHVVSGASGDFGALDNVINLLYSLAPQYRGPGCAWLMNSEVESLLRKMKDGSGVYIWQPALQSGLPATLLGLPVYTSDHVPALDAGSLSLAVGQFSRAYTITDRKTMLLRDPFTAKPYVILYATKRVGGGGGRDTRAVKFMKFSA